MPSAQILPQVPGSVLVVRGIAAVYNYDYIQDLRLHLDGTIEMQVGSSVCPANSEPYLEWRTCSLD